MNPDQRSFTHELRDGIFGSSTYQWEISIKLTDLYLKEQRYSMLEQLEKKEIVPIVSYHDGCQHANNDASAIV